MLDPITILVVLALIFAVLSFAPPVSQWPLLGVSVLLVCVAMLIRHR